MTAQATTATTGRSQPSTAVFGTEVAPWMVRASTVDGRFDGFEVTATAPLALHPFTHALHYGSTCFEGLKAHRGVDGAVRLFRADRHAARLEESARRMSMPQPAAGLVLEMIEHVVRANLEVVPEPPGALYIRPVLMGVDPNIGAAATPSVDALLYVVASPVGDYFAGGRRALSLLVETEMPRTTPQFGRVKAAANYALALPATMAARRVHDVDQVLFAPGGRIQETGAANFLLVEDDRVVTPALDESFLHGVTRDAVLTLAVRSGFTVDERDLSVAELVACAPEAEAALAGTAAVLTEVGSFVVAGEEVRFGGDTGAIIRLRDALVAVQRGAADDPDGWTRIVQ